jgi:hypothetical protein
MKWMEFLHKIVIADENKEVLFFSKEGILTIQVSHCVPVGQWLNIRMLFSQHDQRNPEIMLYSVMDMVAQLNRSVNESRGGLLRK